VLAQHLLDAPTLLVPDKDFVEIEEPAPLNPFAVPKISIGGLYAQPADAPRLHRVHVAGAVTYCDDESFFVEDESGGIRIQAPANLVQSLVIGGGVDACGFQKANGSTCVLAEALVRASDLTGEIKPKKLDWSEASSAKQNGRLVCLNATLLNQRTNATTQVLELFGQQRVFTATLPADQGNLAPIAPGSRILVTGVRDNQNITDPSGGKVSKGQFSTQVNILLRRPGDAVLLGGLVAPLTLEAMAQ